MRLLGTLVLLAMLVCICALGYLAIAMHMQKKDFCAEKGFESIIFREEGIFCLEENKISSLPVGCVGFFDIKCNWKKSLEIVEVGR